ncbi:hypothetical protein RIF29_27790 [Crotalaria pallida]|uniref:Uncharacterized protein n=1 Tax=Crotalaria pallida TaxID=3830 RepID=A0AAN9EQ86_CROPI
MHMLLVDNHGDKIEAYVTVPNVKFFGNHLKEGLTYDFACLGVEANATRHGCRLKITFTTIFEVVATPIYPESDFDFSSVDMVHTHGYDPSILRDVCGVLTGFTLERSCTIDGVTTKLALIELADEHGTMDCCLVGDYVNQLMRFLSIGDVTQTVVVLQTCRVLHQQGRIVCYTVANG